MQIRKNCSWEGLNAELAGRIEITRILRSAIDWDALKTAFTEWKRAGNGTSNDQIKGRGTWETAWRTQKTVHGAREKLITSTK